MSYPPPLRLLPVPYHPAHPSRLQEKRRIADMEAAREAAEARASASTATAEVARAAAVAEARRRIAAETAAALNVQVAAKVDLTMRERDAEDAVVARLLAADNAAATALREYINDS